MLRSSIVSSQTRLLSLGRQRATTQFPAGYRAANSAVARGQQQRYVAQSRNPAPTSATPASPASESPVPPETVSSTAPSATGQGQTSPPSSIQPPQPPTGDAADVAAGPPPTPKKGRFRKFLFYLILTSGLAYGGGVFLALKSDNFHDFFTEYVPYGEESVLYFEERDFYRRFPNATRHSNRLPAPPKEEAHKVTIPSNSGLSWKIASEESSGSDLTQKGPHNSATTVTKAKEDSSAKKAEASTKKQEVKATPKEEPRKPAVTPATTLELIKVDAAEEPVVQELAKVFNDIITVISADGAADKYSTSIAKARAQLESIGEKIVALRSDAQKEAKEEIDKAHALFDESAQKLMRQIEEARAIEAAQFREEYETERERLSRAYQEKVRVELQKAQEVAEQRLKNELVEQAIELNRKYLNDVKDLVEREREGRLSKISELTANVNELEKLTADWSEVIDSNLKTQQLQVALDAVRSVLDNATTAKPFVRELIAVKELASDDPVVAAAIASINPTAYQRGIPTTSQMIERFRRVANEVRKASHLSEDAGIARHAASFALSKVKFKNDELADGDDVESVLRRTQHMLEEGRLEDAAREMNGLDGWAKILSKDWLADVRRILEVQQALDVMETEARLQCLRVES